ncbi:rRNA pseudouridine synthase [Rubneribacter badeniensis]|uniref:Pseudouridine synthase n=1 Tax=Rubneribacter badeniensis TaxID=2070688 RepID=A0A2K2U6A2_9ACTN|nr:pseudouridine synthase [Rubneribacter badeniensis]OUO88596.1 pseudouridine synthase [Gordonibacter sp. An232A]PNV65804.1 rRNA pseudouridine synthase [Rubneribacter badeniensis]
MDESTGARVVPMRLQKFLARAGVASRRGSENLMTAGRVTVNGRVVTELGSKVDPRVDEVAVDGRAVRLADGPVTLMLHKPAGYVTTMSDPQGRPTVADLVPTDRHPGLFPVGRLDADTTGLLLFSTDGELGNGLLHPKRHVTKRYLACVEGRPAERELARLRRGIDLDDGPTRPADVRLLEGAAARRAERLLDMPPAAPPRSSKEYAAVCEGRAAARSIVRVALCEGRKRQVKRMLAAVGHPVVALHRDSFGPLGLGGLPRGEWRELSAEEVAALHAAALGRD